MVMSIAITTTPPTTAPTIPARLPSEGPASTGLPEEDEEGGVSVGPDWPVDDVVEVVTDAIGVVESGPSVAKTTYTY